MKTLLLVDGSSYLYRAFHAMSQSDLRSPQGEPTGAIFGVLNMLRKLRADYPADYSACVFDAKGKTFREDWYPEYKAHRAPMPEDLVAQIAPLHEAIAAFGWNILMVDGVEADDVIGTLAQQAGNDGARCIISTGDKDLTQLVNEHVLWVNTMSEEKLGEAVKVPISQDGLKVVNVLENELGIATNVTCMMSLNQAYLAALAGATYVSIFFGRIKDMGYDPQQVISDTREMLDREELKAQIITGSIRHFMDVNESLLAGAHIVTVTPPILKKMTWNPASETTIEEFNKIWREMKAKGQIR